MFSRESSKHENARRTFNDYFTWLVKVKPQAYGGGKISLSTTRETYSLFLYENIRCCNMRGVTAALMLRTNVNIKGFDQFLAEACKG